MRVAVVTALAVLLLAGCGDDGTVSGEPPAAPERMTLSTPGFENGGTIPTEYTCEGRNLSPPLAWRGTPRAARELALLVEDPDAPGGTYVHWVVFALDPRTEMLDAGTRLAEAQQGRNSAGDARYTGPCPPKGDAPHRYVFSIYALREPSFLDDGASAEKVLERIRAIAMATGRLTGRFGR